MGWDEYLWVVGDMEHLAYDKDKEVGDLTKCENVHKIRRQMLMTIMKIINQHHHICTDHKNDRAVSS